MATEITITFGDDDRDLWLVTFGELEWRFGSRCLVERVDLEDIDDDEITVDDVARALSRSNDLSREVDAVAKANGLTRDQALVELRDALGQERPQQPDSPGDDAPPHGLPRPVEQIRPTDSSPRALAIKRLVIEAVACPTCHQPAGKACGSKGQNYGVQHVHAARIDAFYAQGFHLRIGGTP